MNNFLRVQMQKQSQCQMSGVSTEGFATYPIVFSSDEATTISYKLRNVRI